MTIGSEPSKRGVNTIMIEGKGLGNKKINRVNVSLTNEVSKKLNRLATACNMKPTTLACTLIEMGLNDTQTIFKLQQEYNIYSAYKVVPVNHKGQIEYVLRS